MVKECWFVDCVLILGASHNNQRTYQIVGDAEQLQ